MNLDMYFRYFAASLVAFLMATNIASATPRTPLTLICINASPSEILGPNFAVEFCAELGRMLEQSLPVSIQLPARPSSQTLELRIVLRSKYSATVEMRRGISDGSTFSGGEPTTATLSSYDAPISGHSAQVLVRPIAVLLGLM